MKGKDTKPHIGIFGRRNFGKSSIINVLTGQDVAIVSEIAGTTTDPVKKSVEIFGIGPAIIVDTAGIDDLGELGQKRIQKSMQAINQVDLAILVIANNTFGDFEERLIARFNQLQTNYIIVYNKQDENPLNENFASRLESLTSHSPILFSAKTKFNFDELVEQMKIHIPETAYIKQSLFGGLIKPKDLVLLITPIDSEAPEGRMILPQMMAVRDVLDNDCICVLVKETELEDFFRLGIKPALCVTDSQAFKYVSSIVPEHYPLTSFSIVFARMRADFDAYLKGTPKLKDLKDGDKVLILESCTHHVSCEDIGRHKIPAWLNKYSGKKIEYQIVAGLEEIKEDIHNFAMVIQCGGCMVTKKQLTNRLKPFIDAGIPVSNYGMAIAYMNGIFDRVTEVFKNSQI